jgi:hypothetical protein
MNLDPTDNRSGGVCHAGGRGTAIVAVVEANSDAWRRPPRFHPEPREGSC